MDQLHNKNKNSFTYIRESECIIFTICNIKNSSNNKDINKTNILTTKNIKRAKKFGINKILQIIRLKNLKLYIKKKNVNNKKLI